MKNIKKAVFFGLVIGLLFTGCSKGGETASSGEQTQDGAFNPDIDPSGKDYNEIRNSIGVMPKLDGTIKLGSVAKAFENEYWRTLKEGEELAAKKFKEKGYNLEFEMKSAQGEGDEQGQLSIVEDMINKKFTALLLSPISDGNLVPGVEKAKKAGIPVVNVNDGIIKNSDMFVGPKAIMNGELAAEWISGKIGGSGEVAIVIGMPKAFAARQRTLGFENWIKANAPGIKIVEKQNADWDRAKAKDLAEKLEGFSYLIVGTTPKFSEEFFEMVSGLEYVARFGIGYNNVDVVGAKKHAVIVSNMPGALEKDDVAEQAVELFEFGHVRLAVDDVSFVGQDADQVAGEVGFDGADAQGFFHGVCDRDGFQVIGREIHREAVAVTGDDQFAAEGLEDVAAGVGFDEMGQDISRPQGRMAAEVDFTARRKPAQVPVIAFFDGKGRFG